MEQKSKSPKADDGFLLVIDETGKMIYISDSVIEHIGFRALDLNGQSWFSLLHPDDQVYSRAHLRQAVTQPRTPHQESPTTDTSSELTVRLLQGNRPRSHAQVTSSSASSGTVTREAITAPDNKNLSPSSQIDVNSSDLVFVYRPYHFSGAVKLVNTNSNAPNEIGLTRNVVVWMAVGRAVAAGRSDVYTTTNDSQTTPAHFVMRQDLAGRINYVDNRCKYFTGYDASDLIGQVIFDHLVEDDGRYLSQQYDKLMAGCESIAVVYRFRSALQKNDISDTYLTCRAYLTLNPMTFRPDQITSLAAAISNEDGQAEVSKQLVSLSQTKNKKTSPTCDQTKLLPMTCSVQHNSGSDKENCQQQDKKSPQQSPDSNTHPIDISPLSAASECLHGGGPLVDQVAIISSSQYSPSKLAEDTSTTSTPALPPLPTMRTSLSSPAIANCAKLPTVQENTPAKPNNRRHQNGKSSSKSKSPEEELQRKIPPQDEHYFQPHPEQIEPTPFHDQLRKKHIFLETSIRNQQQQLQMLHQKLLQLANQGAGIYPMQMQLQSPLNKVMELQGRVARHKEETQQQRSLVDGDDQSSYSHHPGILSRRNSTPAAMPVRNNRQQQHQTQPPPNLPRRSSEMHFQTNLDYDNSGRRSAGVLSPPFVDMAEQQQHLQSLQHSNQHHAQGDNDSNSLLDSSLDAFYNSLELDSEVGNLGPDFEEKLRELEMIFAPNFSMNSSQQGQLPPVQGRSMDNNNNNYTGSSGSANTLSVNNSNKGS